MAETNRLINRHGMKVLSIVSLIMVAGFVWLLVHPVKVTELNDIIVSTDPITAGRFERYTSRDCHNENVSGKITRNLVIADTEEAPITLGDVSQRPIKCSNIIFIPAALPTGSYQLSLDVCYPQNPIRDAFNPVCRSFKSMPFGVQGNPALTVPGTTNNGTIQQRIDEEAPAESREGTELPGQQQPTNQAPPTPAPFIPEPPKDVPPPVDDPLLCLPLVNVCL